MADDVIDQLLWSRRLPRVSFNLIACLEPVKKDDHYFDAEILVCKFHLGSRKACLRMRRRFCPQMFTGTKFHPKPSRGYGVTKKNLQEEGGVHPSKKIWRRVNKTLDARCALRVFKHFKFLFMNLWMLGAHHLYLI